MASPKPTKTPTPTTAPPTRPAVGTIQLGVVGIDSSHLSEFSRRINTLNKQGQTACQVTQMWTDGKHDMPGDEVEKWRLQAEAFGVVQSDRLDDMLDAVDGVLVLTVNGNRHLEHARPALRRGLPTYIDKPLSCRLDDARAILELARQHKARCYSASSLRFASEVSAAAQDQSLGRVVAIDAYGPGELNPSMPGLFHYGVHTIEMVDALWGPGVERVRCTSSADRDLLDLHYADGRSARLRMERVGAYDFGATLHGSDGIRGFKVDFDGVYDRLVEGMVGFFAGQDPPASLERIVENIAVMQAGNHSAQTGGGWVELDTPLS
ncbi:MAG: Gfo/Idh/MocA family protein [Phycisphaeraceae bacterium]